MCEVDNQLERLMVEWLQCQEHVVDQQVTIYVQNSGNKNMLGSGNLFADHFLLTFEFVDDEYKIKYSTHC